MNKKGIFFTAIVIAIATLFIVSYTFYSVIQERQPVQKRINTMNNFLFSLEEDIPRQLFISGFRIIFLFDKYIIENGEYITNMSDTFEELFYNGTMYGVANNDTQLLMQDAKFNDILASIQDKGSKINVNVTMTNPQINISQVDPWSVLVTLTTDFTMSDTSGLASWNRTWVVNATVPITGLQDPLFAKNGFSRNITISPYINTNFTVLTLNDHASNGYFINNSNAPNFLQRLEGDISANSSTGIESFAVPPFSSVSDVSVIDHEYLQSTPGVQYGCGEASNIYIDGTHSAIYNPC